MDATKLKAWLPFDESTTADKCGNSWAVTGNVSLDTTITKFGGASVHLPSGAYLTANNVIDLNADKWTFDAWAYCVSSTGADGFLALSEGANRRGIIAANDGVYVASSGGSSWQTKNTSLLFPSVKNQWVHLAIVKNGTNVTFYQDGISVWSFTTSGLNNNGVFILGGCSYGNGNNIYFDEVRFFDGVALWTANFTPPTAEDYAVLALELDSQIDFTVDVQRKLSNRFEFTADVQRLLDAHGFEFTADVQRRIGKRFEFAADVQRKLSNRDTVTADVEVRVVNRSSSAGFWRYENPGSGDYIYYHDNITTEEVGYDTSVTGVAFWGGDRNDMVNVPANCTELWIRFDLFLKSSITGSDNTTSFSMGSTSNASSALSIAGYANLVWTLPEQSGWSLCIGKTMYFTLTPGARNAILIYLKSGRTDGIVEGTVGAQTSRYIGNVNNGNDFDNVFFQSSKAAAMFSNIVVSNAPLTLEDGWHHEPVAVEMNIKAPDLCVRKNGTTYTVPFATTQDPPANSVVARLGGQMVYNPLVATDNANASVIKTRYNGNNRALSATFS